VAALYDLPEGTLLDESAAFPAGVSGAALLTGTAVVAAALVVDAGTPGGPLSLARLVRQGGLPPESALPLVEWAEARARASGAACLRITPRRAPGLGGLLADRDYLVTERYLRMVQRGAGSGWSPLPPGVEQRGLSQVGDAAFLAMSNAAFSTVPGALPLSHEDWRGMLASPRFRSDLLCVLVDAEGPLGFVRCELDAPDQGCIEAVAVLPRAAGLGLGRWLLRWGQERLRQAGASRVTLDVADSNAVARELYLSEGFVVEAESESWELVLGA